MIKSLFAVIIGGSVGCTLRWLLSTRFNSLFPNLILPSNSGHAAK